MEIDPVCGMEVDPGTEPPKSVYNGKTYYFCSPGCKRAFDKEPEKYVNTSHPPTGMPDMHKHTG